MLYVDDLFLTGKEELIKDARRIFAVKFEMKDLGMMHYFLGMEVWQSADGISLGQGKYAVEILKRFEMMDCKAMTTPMALNLNPLSDALVETIDAMMSRKIICSLMCLVNTIQDTCFVVNYLSQFLMDPRHAHLVAKNAVRYLKGTIEYGIMYDVNHKNNLNGYVDSYW